MRTHSSKLSPIFGLCLMGQALSGCADKAETPKETSAATEAPATAGTPSKPTASGTAGSVGKAPEQARSSAGSSASTSKPAAQGGIQASGGAGSPAPAAASGGSGGAGNTTPKGGSGGAGGSAAVSDGSDPAVSAVRAAMSKGEYAKLPELTQTMDAAATAHPDDAEIALYAAVVRLWRLSDSASDKKFDLLQQAVTLNEALMRFETAKKLAPEDGRIDAWVAILNLNYGTALGDEAQIAKGVKMLEEAVAKYPAFGAFVRGVALAELPRTDPNFQKAMAAIAQTFDECGAKFDIENPKLDASMANAGGLCGEVASAPHNVEGVLLNMGDIALKSGKLEAAKKVFEAARSAPGWKTWRYAKDLEQRITDADMLSARYLDDDETNDPVLTSKSGMFCSGCHAE